MLFLYFYWFFKQPKIQLTQASFRKSVNFYICVKKNCSPLVGGGRVVLRAGVKVIQKKLVKSKFGLKLFIEKTNVSIVNHVLCRCVLIRIGGGAMGNLILRLVLYS